jgi:hypothetical protein
MVTNVPINVMILPATIVIGNLIEHIQHISHHLRLTNIHPINFVAFEMIAQPYLGLPPLVDSDLVLVDSEVANYFAELLIPMDTDIIEMEDIRIGNIFEVG